MDIVCKKSVDFTSQEWSTYTASFNEVFEKEMTIEEFKHKYLLTIDESSYHSLLENKNIVVGGCSVIPYEYYIGDTIFRIGLVVDVFILEKFRRDSLILYDMYNNLIEILISSDISMVIAVPNDSAYPFWKSIVKWHDIGTLTYYALPIRIGGLQSKLKILNFLSIIFAHLIIKLSSTISKTEQKKNIRINRGRSVLEEHRYTSAHKKVIRKNVFFAYRIVMEDSVNTCYLLDFYNTKKRKKDTKSLYVAVNYIVMNENIDLIVFVGDLAFSQFSLFRIPYRFEPKHLFLMGDNLKALDIPNDLELFKMSNWDFGLFNYDVR